MSKRSIVKLSVVLLYLTIASPLFSQTLTTPRVNTRLYLAATDAPQPLVVGLGGSEGGNAWASNYWKPTRDQFVAKGYAFLAIGYFKITGAPDTLDRIAIEDVHHAIAEAAKDPRINGKLIAIIGGSRGADLALLIASYFKDITCVVAIVPSHAVFPGNTSHFTTSSWTFNGKELPFVPVSEESVPFLMKGDLRGTFETMLKDTVAEKRSLIHVENIKGAVLFLSATKDEIIPSTDMCNKMMARLRAYRFAYPYEHLVIEGSHTEPLKHFDEIFEFLERWKRKSEINKSGI